MRNCLWVLSLFLCLPAVFCQTSGTYSFSAYSYPQLEIRHCQFQLFATSQTGDLDDFDWYVVPALNKASGAISFQSFNYPDRYVTVVLDPSFAETTRLGISPPSNLDDASFRQVAGLADKNYASFISLSKNANYSGKYITLNNVVSGACSYSTSAGDVYLADGPSHTTLATWKVIHNEPPPPPDIIIEATNVTHRLNKYFLGCHSDSGYVHQPRGFYAQMIFGDCFEEPWNTIIETGVMAKIGLDSATLFNGKSSMKIDYSSGSSFAGVSNRGLGNEGLVFYDQKAYDGYLFVKSTGSTKVYVAIEDYENNKELASTTFNLGGSGDWQQINFTFTLNGGTNCVGIAQNSDPEVQCGNFGPGIGHVCVKCGGQFTVGLQGPGVLNIGYVYLQPGSWGRYKDLPVLASAVSLLQSLGITSIRQGGTFSQIIKWKDWRGPPTQRASMGLTWGTSLISGWGPFEMIDLCNNVGWEPIITLSEDESLQDWSDLVEYCWGDSSTTWGKQRITDGHPNVYNVTIFELGNEEYNPSYVDQVNTMETKAKSLGLGNTLYYMFPTNEGVNSGDANKAQSLGLPIDHLMPDIHVGGGGAVELAESDFNTLPNFLQSAINCETNAGIHTHNRAMQESFDLQDWFSVLPPTNSRLIGRTASFCMERSGHYDNFDQGITFFLPNMTWIQPPGYVHQMISQNYQEQALAIQLATSLENEKKDYYPTRRSHRVSTAASPYAISAQKSNDGSKIILQLVNNIGNESTFKVSIQGANTNPTVTVTQLANSDLNAANPPSNPTLVSPVKSTINLPNGANVTVPAYSFSIFQFTTV